MIAYLSLLRTLSDRAAVLFLGVAVGMAIGYAFAGNGSGSAPSAAAPNVSTQAKAETQTRPLEYRTPFRPALVASIKDAEKINVGVFGDSFGDGLWSGLYRQLPASDGFRVEKYSTQSTGFTRYASLNLETHLAEQLTGKRIDIAVISYGANDTQGVMHKGHYAALLSPKWKEAVGERIDRYVGLLRRHGAVVYWVGLPAMRKESYDADIAGMNVFYAERMGRLGVPFIETRSKSVDASGAYAAYLPDQRTGAPRLMRANDGIHMSMNGYAHLTDGLADRIRRYVDTARQATKAETPPASASTGKDDNGA